VGGVGVISGNYAFVGGGQLASPAATSAFTTSKLTAQDAAMVFRSDEEIIAIEIGDKTFTPGTYRSASAITFAAGTVVTLDGLDQANPEWLFQAGTSLTTLEGASFVLIRGAKVENILWALGSTAVLGVNSVFEGSILAKTSITFNAGSKINGCALASTTLSFTSGNTVTLTGTP
jgi:hypothetical protein